MTEEERPVNEPVPPEEGEPSEAATADVPDPEEGSDGTGTDDVAEADKPAEPKVEDDEEQP